MLFQQYSVQIKMESGGCVHTPDQIIKEASDIGLHCVGWMI